MGIKALLGVMFSMLILFNHCQQYVTEQVAITPDPGLRRVPCAAELRPTLFRFTADHGNPWLTAFAQRSRFAEGFQSSAKGQPDTGQFRES